MERFSTSVALIITNIIKLAGLYVGVKAAVAPRPEAIVLAFAGFMITGGQISEGIVLGIIDRFFGVDRKNANGSRKDVFSRTDEEK